MSLANVGMMQLPELLSAYDPQFPPCSQYLKISLSGKVGNCKIHLNHYLITYSSTV